MKYAPVFPERFGSIGEARAFMDDFTTAYNHQHHHTGIGLHIPADVHYGHAHAVGVQRSAALEAARPDPPRTVRHQHRSQDPRVPENAWINKPTDNEAAAA